MTKAIKDKTLAALRDEALVATLQRHLEEGASLQERFDQGAAAISSERFVMPVVGVQGAGKSTFLNGLVFDEPVLPIEADETTSVPTEVAYRSGATRVWVCFKDGREEEIEASEEALAPFVDNASNPGNEKNVDRVRVETEADLLNGGLVLVDLPGVGSLTPANLETTQNYLKQSVSMVYLLRTVPPLTAREAGFLGGCWPQLPGALFVQNQWAKEGPEEVEDGREHNVHVLSEVAKKHHVPIDGEPHVHVVQAYDALHGALTGDSAERTASGMTACEAAIHDATGDWREKLVEFWRRTLIDYMVFVGDRIQTRSKGFEDGKAQVERDIREERQSFEKYVATLDQRVSSARRLLRDHDAEAASWLRKWATETSSKLRTQMRSVMSAGVVDGPNLSSALRDNQADALDDLMCEYQERLSTMHAKLAGIFEDLQCPIPNKPASLAAISVEAARKVETIIPLATGTVSGIGAGAAGGWAGLKIGAAIGASGGPIGLAIGGAAGGIAGAIVGGWLGSKAKNKVTEVRAGNNEPVVFEAIDSFTRGTSSQLETATREAVRLLRDGIDESVRKQREDFEAGHRRRLADLEAPAEDQKRIAAELHSDLELIANKRNVLENAHGDP